MKIAAETLPAVRVDRSAEFRTDDLEAGDHGSGAQKLVHLAYHVDSMAQVTGSDDRDLQVPSPRWLTAEELRSWLSVVRLMTWLPWSIDQQLQRDSKLSMMEYQVLAMLSESPEWTMRMSLLAEVTNASLSRLSHLVKRLEGRGFVHREPDPADGRFTNAILCEDGFQALARAAPKHLAHVRALVIDVLSPEQLRRLGRDAERIMSRVDTSGIN